MISRAESSSFLQQILLPSSRKCAARGDSGRDGKKSTASCKYQCVADRKRPSSALTSPGAGYAKTRRSGAASALSRGTCHWTCVGLRWPCAGVDLRCAISALVRRWLWGNFDPKKRTVKIIRSVWEAFLAIQPVHQFLTRFPSFSVQQHPDFPVAIANPGLRDLPHPHPQGRSRLPHAVVAEGRNCQPRHTTGTPLAHPGSDRGNSSPPGGAARASEFEIR